MKRYSSSLNGFRSSKRVWNYLELDHEFQLHESYVVARGGTDLGIAKENCS